MHGETGVQGRSTNSYWRLQIATTLYARTEGRLQSRPEISRPYHDSVANFVMLESSICDLSTYSVANFVMPESSIYDLNTDSALCDFAGAPATIADSTRDEDHSLADRVSVLKCIYCTGSHGLEDCGKFLLSSVKQRSALAGAMRVCLNCLQSGHFAPK